MTVDHQNIPYIAVLDFGGQYAHLIANRLRRLGVMSRIHHSQDPVSDYKLCKGIIFSGGPSSVYAEGAPQVNQEIFSLNLPILGICYGHQLICQTLGGKVGRGEIQEFGIATLNIEKTEHPLAKDIPSASRMWMSHGDKVEVLPEGFEFVGTTEDCPTAFISHTSKPIYGIQFHPEVTHSEYGSQLLQNFVNQCEIEKNWDMKSYLKLIEERLLEQVPEDKKVFLLVSGGVDSTVAFVLLNKIFGKDRVFGLHIDTGLMRKGESAAVMEFLHAEGLDNLKVVDASPTFLSRLAEKSEPEEKRGIIGDAFIDVKNEEINNLGLDPEEWIMAQGTIYPDTIESGGTDNADTIKTHHNRVPSVVELIEQGLVIEPLADLYKDEVRELGEHLEIPHPLIWRHPFPGPGLGVRLLCDAGSGSPVAEKVQTEIDTWLQKEYQAQGEILPIQSVGVQGDARSYAHPLALSSQHDWKACEAISTACTNRFRDVNRLVLTIGRDGLSEYTPIRQYCEKGPIETLQEVDDLCTKFLIEKKLYEEIWQMPVVLLPLQWNGKPVIVLRPVNSAEAMTANFSEIDPELLQELWNILRENGVGALLYDITHKPPGTIEWE